MTVPNSCQVLPEGHQQLQFGAIWGRVTPVPCPARPQAGDGELRIQMQAGLWEGRLSPGTAGDAFAQALLWQVLGPEPVLGALVAL